MCFKLPRLLCCLTSNSPLQTAQLSTTDPTAPALTLHAHNFILLCKHDIIHISYYIYMFSSRGHLIRMRTKRDLQLQITNFHFNFTIRSLTTDLR